ncbi:hypothetical protein M4578_03040 [Salipiger sp. P9]|uniref:hypothetical protein n=1 Tax=Salipiger pentaromativorans TaxID=2943193 RepID=UPI002157A200|nr:hypothetical protein [Salipiger pentaromativorans]MCR8546790.1 hypothetical protein [Salipiger pentaromativorans]
MIPKMIAASIVLGLWGATAAAEDIPYVSSEGHEYRLTCTRDGYVLTSMAPVSRFTGQGAATQVARRTETLYLGRSCDSFLDVAGAGTWGWANGGFGAEFPGGLRVMFPRQELYCAPRVSYAGACRW